MSRFLRSPSLRCLVSPRSPRVFSVSRTALKSRPCAIAQQYGMHSGCPSNTFSRGNMGLIAAQPITLHMQAGVLYGLGDVIAQVFLDEKPLKDLDILRTLRFFALGAIVVGPVSRVWYSFLDKHIRHKNKTIQIVQKVALDQLVFTPIFLAKIIALLSIMQHLSFEKVEEKLHDKYQDILVANYYVWPWTQLANNFGLLPRACPLSELVTIMWSAYFSWRTHKEDSQPEPPPIEGKKGKN